MRIECDPAKRAKTLAERGLDLAQAGEVFDGTHLTFEDDRKDYGEPRLVTFGMLEGRMVCLAWTERQDARRVFSMRKCNDREKARYGALLGL